MSTSRSAGTSSSRAWSLSLDVAKCPPRQARRQDGVVLTLASARVHLRALRQERSDPFARVCQMTRVLAHLRLPHGGQASGVLVLVDRGGRVDVDDGLALAVRVAVK